MNTNVFNCCKWRRSLFASILSGTWELFRQTTAPRAISRLAGNSPPGRRAGLLNRQGCREQ